MLVQAQSVPASARTFIATRFVMPTAKEDISYYRGRIIACEAQAAVSLCPSARRVHEALTQLYKERVRLLERRVKSAGGPIMAPEPRQAIHDISGTLQSSADGVPSA